MLIAEKKAQANTIMSREVTASTPQPVEHCEAGERKAMLWKLKEMDRMTCPALKGGVI